MKNSLRESQFVMLDLLIEFDRVCKKYDLTYWLDFGTLLGAVRHGGFIPWDDDLDVAMPRNDYKKFLKIASGELKESIFLQTKQSDKSFFAHFAKLRDRKSTYIESFEEDRKINYHQGIYMDIFPVNYIEDTKKSRYLYTLLKYIAKLFSNRFIAVDFMAKPLIELTTKFDNKDNSLVVRGGEMMTNELYMNKKEIFPLVKIVFEEYQFSVPKNCDLYLKMFYGSTYMSLPPTDKRKTHHVYINTKQVCDKEKDSRSNEK